MNIKPQEWIVVEIYFFCKIKIMDFSSLYLVTLIQQEFWNTHLLSYCVIKDIHTIPIYHFGKCLLRFLHNEIPSIFIETNFLA